MQEYFDLIWDRFYFFVIFLHGIIFMIWQVTEMELKDLALYAETNDIIKQVFIIQCINVYHIHRDACFNIHGNDH